MAAECRPNLHELIRRLELLDQHIDLDRPFVQTQLPPVSTPTLTRQLPGFVSTLSGSAPLMVGSLPTSDRFSPSAETSTVLYLFESGSFRSPRAKDTLTVEPVVQPSPVISNVGGVRAPCTTWVGVIESISIALLVVMLFCHLVWLWSLVSGAGAM